MPPISILRQAHASIVAYGIGNTPKNNGVLLLGGCLDAELANRYIGEQVLHRSKRVDAQHIAIATLARVDVLVSWNFRHIVNLDRICRYNSVNLRYGYPWIEIRTPREVISYGSSE